MPTEAGLNGVGVLVTRPEHQADNLARLIQARGGTAIRLPMLRIQPPTNRSAVIAMQRTLGSYDRLIYTSANAAARFPENSDYTTHGVQVFAIGAATANALALRHMATVAVGDRPWCSESLLADTAFAEDRVRGLRILIVKGEGGRNLLLTVLNQRRALVHSIAVYRRAAPAANTATLLAAHEAQIRAIVVTSVQSLQHLLALPGCGWVMNLAFVVASERIAQRAVALGVRRIEIAYRVDDEALVAALLRHRAATDAG